MLIEDTDQEECARLRRPTQPESPETEWSHYDLGDRASAAIETPISGTHDSGQRWKTVGQEENTAGTQSHTLSWLRITDGRCQRRVLINQLQLYPQYNGLEGWVDLEQIATCSAERPELLPVRVEHLDKTLRVNSAHLFLVSPNLQPRPLSKSLVFIEVGLTVNSGNKPVYARLVVDCGCELPGVLSTEFVQRQGWQPTPSDIRVRTAGGQQISGVSQVFANSHFAPGFTRRVEYGVLDLPGFDGLLGMGFLNQFLPFTISVTDGHPPVVSLTEPKTGQLIQLKGLDYNFGQAPKAAETEEQGPQNTDTSPVLLVQWEPPSAVDLANVVCAFHINHDQRTSTTHIVDALDSIDDLSSVLGLEKRMSPDEAEGVIFLTATVADRYDHVPDAVRTQLKLVLQQYQESVFKECEFPPFPPTREVDFRIQLEPGAQIPASPVHKLAPALVGKLRDMLKELLQNGLLVPSSSPFAAPLLMVRKPDGSYRICIDYCKLNAVTIKDRYPLPNPAMIFDRLAGCKYFSKLDLRWGYWQIRMAPEDVEKTAFRSPLGSYAWRVMGMGLTNAAPMFQRLMDTIFRDLDFVSAYLDDIMIASKSEEEHLQHIELVLQRLKQHQLLARESKCQFFYVTNQIPGVCFLGGGQSSRS